MRGLRVWLSIAAVVLSAGCGPKVDLTTGLRLDEVSTGWYEATATPDQIKLVPAVSFKLKNVSDQQLSTLQVNAIFKRIDEEHEWGSGFLSATGAGGLQPGAATHTLFVTSQLGYTGTESRFDMLKNSHFVDAKVQVFAKYGSTQWVPIGEYPIARQFLDPALLAP